MEALSIQHLSKVYTLGGGVPALRLRRPKRPKRRTRREIHALHDVSFSVSAGTVLGIVGSNGAGKTTLLKIIGRITAPTSGRIVGRGRVVSLLELGVGFQPWLTGRENVLLSSAVYGVPRAEAERRLAAIDEFAGLEDFFDVPVSRYSSGMYLRLAFSMAVHMDADILLADEVLAVGDAAFQRRCLERVGDERARGRTVLFVSHDLATVTRICDEVIWLSAGRLRDQGDPGDIVGRYESDVWGEGSMIPTDGSFARIVGLDLRSAEGAPLGSVKSSEPLAVAVSFEVLAADAQVWPRLVLTCSGVRVLESAPPEPLHMARPGRHLVHVMIPAGLLADTMYSVDLFLPVTVGDETEILRHSQPLVFRVYSERGHQRGPGAGKVIGAARGVIAPRLEWDWMSAPDVSAVAARPEHR